MQLKGKIMNSVMKSIMQSIILIDLDGTLADASWRLHHIKGQKKNWKAFFEGISQDSAIVQVCNVVSLLITQGHTPVFITGRPEEYRKVSLEWLINNLQIVGESPTLLMRRKNDRREDYVVKQELLEEFLKENNLGIQNVFCAFDDRPKIIQMYQNLGIFTFGLPYKEAST